MTLWLWIHLLNVGMDHVWYRILWWRGIPLVDGYTTISDMWIWNTSFEHVVVMMIYNKSDMDIILQGRCDTAYPCSYLHRGYVLYDDMLSLDSYFIRFKWNTINQSKRNIKMWTTSRKKQIERWMCDANGQGQMGHTRKCDRCPFYFFMLYVMYCLIACIHRKCISQ